MPSKAVPIVLTVNERAVLERMAAGDARNRMEARRARIILACSDPEATNTAVAESLGVERPIVVNWRARFARERVEGLTALPGGAPPRTITPDVEKRILALTLETFPDDAPRWTLRLMAEAVGVSHTAVAKVWKSAGISRDSLPARPATMEPKATARRTAHPNFTRRRR